MTPARSRTSATAAAVVLAGVALTTAGVAGGYLAAGSSDPPSRVPGVRRAPVAPAIAAAARRPRADRTTAAAATRDPALLRTIRRALADADVEGAVVDVATGRLLAGRDVGTAAAPASTAKVLTAAAALAVFGPTHRFVTAVVRGPGRAVTLVGGGDPTLSCAPATDAPRYPGAGRLATLAAAVRRAGIRPDAIDVDDSLFTGPAVSPDWAPDDVPSEYAAAITSLTCDGGRDTPAATVRSATPDLSVGNAFATLLGRPGLAVRRVARPVTSTVLARLRSAPLVTLVTQMLHDSDNVIAETLGRQVAVALGRPVTFRGAAGAIRQVLRGAGVEIGGGMRDASGLAADDRLSPAALVGVLRDAGRSGSRSAGVLAALPVAGWSGTLATRFRDRPTRTAAGLVRAKTGTLSDVSGLAGVVHDRDGRVLAFAFLAERVASVPDAEARLDSVVALLTRCGCGG